MNRKIAWNSGNLDEIEPVYEKAENDPGIGSLMEKLETQALEEAGRNIGLLKTGSGEVLKPEQFGALSDADKETAITVLGNAGISSCGTDIETGTIVFRLSPAVPLLQACTVFGILNRIEKLDGSITVLKPAWTLKLMVPLGGKKGLFQWEMLILQLYPWLSVSEGSTDETAVG